MPEGDTIHRAAARLRPVLVGRTVVRFEAPRARARGPVRRPAAGAVVEAVEAVGKHLLVRFDRGVTLRTHLRMSGSWHVVAAGDRWPKPAHLLRVLVEVEGWQALCFNAPVVELEATVAGRPPAAIAHLGPDLTSPALTPADVDACVARMVAFAAEPIGVVLLDQRVACGVGNVYRSEVLWAEAVDPFAAVADLDGPTRRRLVETAARLLRENTARPGPGRATHRGGLAAYGRTGRPCPRCATPIRSVLLGEQARRLFWCPRCQPGSPTGSS